MNGDSSRRRAREWPYDSHEKYEVGLRESAQRWFAAKGFAPHPRYPYILGEWEDWPKNLILAEVAAYVAAERERCRSERKPFPLHKYAHHGLSSQAMLFNLVGPLIVRGDLQPLELALSQSGIPWPDAPVSAQFEVDDRDVFDEDSGQPTSIDLVLKGRDGAPLFVESKFVEREFGACSVFVRGDCEGRNPAGDLGGCYLHFIGRTYWEHLREHGFLSTSLFAGPICPLAAYYQFFREVLFALHQGGDFVLMYDERNPTFVRGGPGAERGLLPFLLATLPDAAKARIKSVTVQRVFGEIVASGRHGDWMDEFASKYGITV